MTNLKIAVGLRALADAYEKAPAAVMEPAVSFYVWSKDELLSALRSIGGKFTKDYRNDASIAFVSADKLLRIYIPRDKVCKKTVTWECEPLLGPEDEAEIDADELRREKELALRDELETGADRCPTRS